MAALARSVTADLMPQAVRLRQDLGYDGPQNAWALTEEVRWKDGRVWNAQLTNYIIPTSADAPPMRRRASSGPIAVLMATPRPL